MSLTAKDHERILEKPGKARWVYAVVKWILVPLFRPLLRIGFIRRYLGGTTGSRAGGIFACQRRGEHDKAADLAIQALKAHRQRPKGPGRFMHHHNWWQFMRYGVASLENSDDQDKRNLMIALAESGVEPFEGYNVAYAFLAFSRWQYETGDYDGAIEFAEIAARADETWAQPDVTLGWYRLALGGGDAMEHLSRAVCKDHRVIFRIANDAAFRRHPHIMAKLKSLVADDILTVRDEADTEDDDKAD